MSNKINMFMVDVPFVEHRIFFYYGKKGREQFNKHIKHKLPEWIDDSENDGLQFENFIYVEDLLNVKVLYHEISHYLGYLYELLSCTEEPEFKAYLMGDVINNILEEINK